MDLSALDPRLLLENAHLGVVIHRWDTTIVYANPAALRLLRLSYEQLIGRDAMDPGWNFVDARRCVVPPERYPVSLVRSSGEPLRNAVIGVVDSSRAEVDWFVVNAYAERADPASDSGFVVVLFAESTPDRSEFSFRDIVEEADDIVIVTEAERLDGPFGPRIVYVNGAFERLTGYSRKEVIGETPRILQGPLTDREALARIGQALRAHAPVREVVLNYGRQGAPYWLEMNIVPLRVRTGEVTHFAAIERDVSERILQADRLIQRNAELRQLRAGLESVVEARTRELRDANSQLLQLAYYDPLTRLPNRRSFLAQAEKLVAHAARTRGTVAVGVLDLDHFKRINDEHGHEAGDRVLAAAAESFARVFRREDAFGRLGGEEFGLCFPVSPGVDCHAVGERLRAAIAAIGVTLDDGTRIALTASIGIATRHAPADGLEALLREADRALYRAKDAGRDGVVVCD